MPVAKRWYSIQSFAKETGKNLPSRTGVMAVKKCQPIFMTFSLTELRGMTALWNEKGERLPVTILQISRAQVVSVKTRPKHGYWAVQVGIGFRSYRNVSKAMLGHFAIAEVAPKAKVGEFRVRDESGLLPVGKSLTLAAVTYHRDGNTSVSFYRRPVC